MDFRIIPKIYCKICLKPFPNQYTNIDINNDLIINDNIICQHCYIDKLRQEIVNTQECQDCSCCIDRIDFIKKLLDGLHK